MSEKIIFYNVQKDLMYEDYFDIELKDGRLFRWKNFGQVITVDGEDIRKKPMQVEGAIIEKDRFKNIDSLEDYYWFINSKAFYGHEDVIILRFAGDEIYIMINHEFKTRSSDYPEMDYFDWINDYKLYSEFKERMGVDEEKAIAYLNNWRRPKLKTNGIVSAVIYHNSEPIYVGILDGEKKKSSIDAFFRKIYNLKFLHGE